MHVWYATNEYNFDTLINPPTFDLTYCSQCKKRLFYQTVDIYILFWWILLRDNCPITNQERAEIIRPPEQGLASLILPRSSRS